MAKRKKLPLFDELHSEKLHVVVAEAQVLKGYGNRVFELLDNLLVVAPAKGIKETIIISIDEKGRRK
jgi:hypothetical protein